MSTKIYDWFEEKAKRLSLRTPYDQWYHREQMRMVQRTIDANNKWMLLRRQEQQQQSY